MRDVAQPRVAAQRQGLDVAGPPDLRVGADQQHVVVRLETAGGNIEARPAHDPRHIVDRQAVAGQLHRIDDDAKDLLLAAEQDDRRDALYAGKFARHVVFGQPGQRVLRQAVADKGEADDRPRIDVRLGHRHVLDAFRQPPFDRGHRLAHVVRRHVEIDIRRELGADPHIVFLAGRVDRLDAVHARDRALKDTGDFGVHGFRRRAVEEGPHHDDRPVHVRQLTDLDAQDRGQAGDHDKQVQDDDQSGTAHRQRGQAAEVRHYDADFFFGAASRGAAFTLRPGRKPCTPSTTMISPFFRSPSTSTRPPSRRTTLT